MILRSAALASLMLALITHSTLAQSNEKAEWRFRHAEFGGVFNDPELLDFASHFFSIAAAVQVEAVVSQDRRLGYFALGHNVFSDSFLSDEFAPPTSTLAGEENLRNLNLDTSSCNVKEIFFSNGSTGVIIAADINEVGREGLKRCFLFGVSITGGVKYETLLEQPVDLQALILLGELLENG